MKWTMPNRDVELEPDMSWNAIGRELGITGEYARLIGKQALRKLRLRLLAAGYRTSEDMKYDRRSFGSDNG
jgi:hypothetical protein